MYDTPYTILDRRLMELQDFYKDQEQKLRAQKLPKEQHNSAVANMQADYDSKKFQIESIRKRLVDIEDSVDPKRAKEAMWRMVLPEEHAAAMFPKPVVEKEPEERVPVSPSGLESHVKLMSQFAKGAKEEPGWEWGPPKRTQENMIKQYVGWRDAVGYDNYTPGQQRQLDIQWDDLMKANPHYKWNPISPEIKALRPYGSKVLGAAAKKVSPFAASFGKKTTMYERRREAAQTKKLYAETAKLILQEAGGDKTKARELARQRGYSF